MIDVVRVTSKGQATIPAGLRVKFGIRAPGLVRFVERGGRLVVEPVPTPREMRGILKRLGEKESLSELLRRERREDLERESRRLR